MNLVKFKQLKQEFKVYCNRLQITHMNFVHLNVIDLLFLCCHSTYCLASVLLIIFGITTYIKNTPLFFIINVIYVKLFW